MVLILPSFFCVFALSILILVGSTLLRFYWKFCRKKNRKDILENCFTPPYYLNLCQLIVR